MQYAGTRWRHTIPNVFYTPSGNPAQGSQELSAPIRAEFAAIGNAFNMVPQIITTGTFSTTFTQQGNFTFTLPAASGTLAMLSDVATEATARAAADATNAAGVASNTAAIALLAPIASPAFTGTPTVPTPVTLDNSTKAVNSSWVSSYLAASGYAPTGASPVTSVASRTGAVVLTHADLTDWAATLAPYAPIATPTFTGVPAAPTAAPGVNTTQLATTAFVAAAVAPLAPIASPTFTGTVTGVALTLSGVLTTTGNIVSTGGTNSFAGATTMAALTTSGTLTTNGALVINGNISSIGGVNTFTGATTMRALTATTGAFSGAITSAGAGVVLNNAGTYGINISGNAATATSATSATSAGTATNVSGSGTVTAASGTFSGLVQGGVIQSNSATASTFGDGWAMGPTGPGSFGGGSVSYGFIASGSNMLATSFVAVCDVRVKLNIEDIGGDDALRWLYATRPVTYRKLPTYDAAPEAAVFEAGVIAQEQVKAGYGQYVVARRCEGMPELIDADGYRSEADTELGLPLTYQVAYLVAALKTALARIETLEARA